MNLMNAYDYRATYLLVLLLTSVTDSSLVTLRCASESSLAPAWVSVASYPGHVGGERRPHTRPFPLYFRQIVTFTFT